MNEQYAMAFFEAVHAAMYITDPTLRDDVLKEIMFINVRMFPKKQAPENIIPQQESGKAGIARRMAH